MFMKFFGKKKILVVDDSEIDLDLVENMLQDKYKILLTKSGQEALTYLFRNKVDLVLLDLIMPEMDGWETFSRIKDLGVISNVPIAFLTSVYGTTEQERAKEMGAADYIFKPYTKEVLMERVKIILKKSLQKKIARGLSKIKRIFTPPDRAVYA